MSTVCSYASVVSGVCIRAVVSTMYTSRAVHTDVSDGCSASSTSSVNSCAVSSSVIKAVCKVSAVLVNVNVYYQ